MTGDLTAGRDPRPATRRPTRASAPKSASRMGLAPPLQQVLDNLLSSLYNLQTAAPGGQKRYYSAIFRDLPDRRLYPDYYIVIKEPRCLHDIMVRYLPRRSTSRCSASNLRPRPPRPLSAGSQVEQLPTDPRHISLNRTTCTATSTRLRRRSRTTCSSSGPTRVNTTNKAVSSMQTRTSSR